MTSSSRQRPRNDASANRPSVVASSVYSQPSPELRDEYPRPALSPEYYGEISPPNSPTRSFADDNGGVSPIDEHSYGINSSRKPSQRQGSQIPVPRKAAPDSTAAGQMRKVTPAKEWTKDVGKKPMQWDDYSGEPTFDGAGKPGQVKPGEFNPRTQLRPVARKAYQPPAGAEQETKTEFRDKASRFAQKGLVIDTETRPAWKGASGRQAIVSAPKDNPGLPPPKPRRSSNQMDGREKSQQISAPQTAVRSVAPGVETAQVAASSSFQENDNGSYRPTAPLKVNKANNPKTPRQDASQATAGYERTGYPSPVSPTEQALTPTQGRQEYRSSPAAPRSGDITLPKRASHTNTDKSSQSGGRLSDNYPDPVSRFSWTTTATSTSTNYQHSPPPSPPPPMPVAFANISAPSPVGSDVTARVSPDVAPSILSRGHPTRRLGDQAAEDPPSPPFSGRSFSITSRKPVPVPSYTDSEPIKQEIPFGNWREGSTFRVPRRAASIAPSIATTTADKALPKTPGELSSVDLITSLQAQQNDLQRQRFNIQRVIRDLEKPGEQNPLMTDFRARKEKDKRCAVLKLDLAEVISQEHDVGLRLHRAWKRREKEDPNTPGSILWVRRARNGV
jgi:hypothetical protein